MKVVAINLHFFNLSRSVLERRFAPNAGPRITAACSRLSPPKEGRERVSPLRGVVGVEPVAADAIKFSCESR